MQQPKTYHGDFAVAPKADVIEQRISFHAFSLEAVADQSGQESIMMRRPRPLR
jgi:hypothetical protein